MKNDNKKPHFRLILGNVRELKTWTRHSRCYVRFCQQYLLTRCRKFTRSKSHRATSTFCSSSCSPTRTPWQTNPSGCSAGCHTHYPTKIRTLRIPWATLSVFGGWMTCWKFEIKFVFSNRELFNCLLHPWSFFPDLSTKKAKHYWKYM